MGIEIGRSIAARAIVKRTILKPRADLPPAAGSLRGRAQRAVFGIALPGMLALGMLAGPVSVGAQQAITGDPAAGRDKNSMCAGCHSIPGYKASFPEVYQVPLIGGQHEVYLVNSLKAYRSGERNHPTMRAIARGLTDQDIADLAAFYARLPD